MDTNEAILTAPIQLVQSKVKEQGFLYLLPYYKNKANTSTLSERRANLEGWVYMAIVARRMLQGATEIVENEIDFELYDVTDPTNHVLIYDDDGVESSRISHDGIGDYGRLREFNNTKIIELAGRTFQFRASELPSFHRASTFNVYLVAIFGAIFGFLIYELLQRQKIALEHTKILHEDSLLAYSSYKTINDSHNIISETDEKGFITWVNDNFCRISGYSREELIGQRHKIINSGTHSQVFWRDMWRTIKAGEIWRETVCNKNKAGELYWVDTTIAPIQTPTGEDRFISVRTDVTSMKEASRLLEKALNEARDATQAKSQFLAHMSHEIRTPLGGIIGMAEILDETELNSEQKEHTRAIQSCAQSLLLIINDILDLSKIEANHLTIEKIPSSIYSLIDELKALQHIQAEKKNVHLTWCVKNSVPPSVNIDPIRTKQILINLVGNAIKFTSSGGTVRVEIDWIVQSETDGVLQLTVTDSGIGIPDDKLSSIFESFTQADASTTRKYGGTGLGLTITKNLAELMGGSIRVQSEVREGSTFTVEIPSSIVTHPQGQNTEQKKYPDKDVARRALNILLAEDNEVNQKLIRILLEKIGHTITIVDNGIEAISMVMHNQFDIVLMDVQMPIMDGIEATKRIRNLADETHRKIPIVALTASARPEDKKQCLDAGMDEYVSKPIQRHEIFDAIHRLLS